MTEERINQTLQYLYRYYDVNYVKNYINIKIGIWINNENDKSFNEQTFHILEFLDDPILMFYYLDNIFHDDINIIKNNNVLERHLMRHHFDNKYFIRYYEQYGLNMNYQNAYGHTLEYYYHIL